MVRLDVEKEPLKSMGIIPKLKDGESIRRSFKNLTGRPLVLKRAPELQNSSIIRG